VKIETVQFEASYGLGSQLPESTLPEIVFAGRSNVGKSSLLNKLTNRKALARTSAVPGKTITINFFRLDTCRFVDLPGYGYAKRSLAEQERWSQSIDHYFTSDRKIHMVIQLVDMRHPPSKDDLTMVDFLMQTGTPFMVALTKSDKLNKTQTAERLTKIREELSVGEDIKIIPFSALKGTGAAEIRNYIASSLQENEKGTQE